jgi:hypothetical protein
MAHNAHVAGDSRDRRVFNANLLLSAAAAALSELAPVSMRSCANAEHPEAMATELEPPNFFGSSGFRVGKSWQLELRQHTSKHFKSEIFLVS